MSDLTAPPTTPPRHLPAKTDSTEGIADEFTYLYQMADMNPSDFTQLAKTTIHQLKKEYAHIVLHYATANNVAEVATKMGLTDQRVVEILNMPRVKRALQIVQMDMLYQLEKDIKIDRQFIQAGILRNIHALEAKGKHEATFKGYELLGKSIAMFTDNLDVSASAAPLSDTERAHKLAALMELARMRAEKHVDGQTVDMPVRTITDPPPPPVTKPRSFPKPQRDEDLI